MSIRDTIRSYEVRWRTLALAAAVAMTGVVQEIGIVQIRDLLSGFVSDEHVLGLVMITLSLLFACMRLISDKPVLTPADPYSVPGKGVDEGP